MSHELLLTLSCLSIAIVMFTLGKPRIDVVAVMIIVALPVSGVLTLTEALSGFSDPNVILIAAMFILGGGLVNTGLAYRMRNWLAHKSGNNEARLLLLVMLLTAALGSVMSSTGVVAIFIPVVLTVSRRMKSSPSRLMMPLGFAGLISGMLTLVATPPNMVVQSELVRAGYQGFSFFSFTPIGLVILILGTGYMLLARRYFGGSLPEQTPTQTRRTIADFIRDYNLAGRERRVLVMENSSLIGVMLIQMQLRADFGINVLAIERRLRGGRRIVVAPDANTFVEANDVLLLDFFDQKRPLEPLLRKYHLKVLSLKKQSIDARNRDGRDSHSARIALNRKIGA